MWTLLQETETYFLAPAPKLLYAFGINHLPWTILEVGHTLHSSQVSTLLNELQAHAVSGTPF